MGNYFNVVCSLECPVICAIENNKIIDPLFKSPTHEAASIKRPSITITYKFKCRHESPEQTAQLQYLTTSVSFDISQ